MQTKIINADSMEHLKTLDENIFISCEQFCDGLTTKEESFFG